MIRQILKQAIKQAIRQKLRSWLDDEPEPAGGAPEVDEEDLAPFWAYMVPVPQRHGETLEQTVERATQIPDAVTVRKLRACQCGLEVVFAVIPADLTEEQALLAVENPKMLPGDIFVELWDPVVASHYDHEGVLDFWAAHNRLPHKGQAQTILVPIPPAGNKGGSDGGSAPPN